MSAPHHRPERLWPRQLRLVAMLALPLPALAQPVTLDTARGAPVQALVQVPPGAGPFPAIVLAPGQGYHMALPALEQTAQRLLTQGFAVVRFNWAYFTAQPKPGAPSKDLADELQDLRTVLAAAKADPRIRVDAIAVGGKSLGSVVAWRALAQDPSLRAGLFLTPVCSRIAPGQAAPTPLGEQNYPGLRAEARPLLFVLGDRDPLCDPAVMYRMAAESAGPARVAVVGGDHSFEQPADPADRAEEMRRHNLAAVAELAASFLASAAGPHR